MSNLLGLKKIFKTGLLKTSSTGMYIVQCRPVLNVESATFFNSKNTSMKRLAKYLSVHIMRACSYMLLMFCYPVPWARK